MADISYPDASRGKQQEDCDVEKPIERFESHVEQKPDLNAEYIVRIYMAPQRASVIVF